MMVAQVTRMPTAATFSTVSNASLGATKLMTTPNSATKAVIAMPPYGTPALFMRAANLGADPATAIDRRIRPVE